MLRHVGPTRVTVGVDYDVDALHVRVNNQGGASGRGGGAAGAGRGLLGMRERCQLLGGDLDAGPLAAGGFGVTARLPLAPTGAAAL